MRVLPTKKTFKRVLRTWLLNILQNKDDYIQIPMIIKKVGEVEENIFFLYFFVNNQVPCILCFFLISM